jgi:RNA polymerase sigma factor (sigma-70 family)
LALRCQPDSRLVALSREGSEPAFEEIVGRYRASLVAFAAAIVPLHRAEDVVQESLTKAHSALRTGDAEINLRPWLYTIVRNRAFNDLRDQPVHEHLDESYDGVPQPPDVVARREELRSLVGKVKALPEAQRKALVQRELEGRSHEEIATALALTPGAIRGLIFRARTTLRDAAGLVIPMPAMRYLVGISSSSAGGAALGTAAGGGAGVIVKLGAGLTVAALAVGSGVALENRGTTGAAKAEAASEPLHSSHHAGTTAAGSTSTTSGDQSGVRPDGTSQGDGGGGAGSSANEGPGSTSGGDSGGSSGPGGGGDTGSSSGPGSGDDGSSGGDDSSSGSSGSGGDDGSGGGGSDDSSSSGDDSSGSSDDSSGSGSGTSDDSSDTSDLSSGTSDGSSGSGGDSSGSGSGDDTLDPTGELPPPPDVTPPGDD